MDDTAPRARSAVAEELRRRITADISGGRLRPGERLGSERELAETYGVSRSTLRQVLSALQEAGLVHRTMGRSGGTFVSRAKVERDLSHLVGVPAYLARQGYAAGSRILSTRMGTPDDDARAALRLTGDQLVIDIRRLRLVDGAPLSLEHAQLSADRFPGLLERSLGGSLYELLEREYGVVPAQAEELIEVVAATRDEGSVLGVESGTTLLSITRTTVDLEGAPFEFSRDLFRGDRTRVRVRTAGRGVRGLAQQEGQYVELRAIQTDG